MFTIGEFAKHGRVSVRMLRHYDAIGLLRPVHTDPTSSYRYYEAGQLARLNRVIALKDLGFSLHQVKALLDDDIGTEELRGMLRLRRAELESAVAEAVARLAQVEARLRTIENEGRMPTEDIVIKSLPPLRLAELSATAASFEPQHIGPVIGPLFERLCGLLDTAGVTPTGPGLAYYEDAPEGGGAITVHAGLPVGAQVGGGDFQIVQLPGVERAATVVHRGPMEGEMLATSQALARWIDANGYRSTGYPREVSLHCPEDRTQWVTELQDPIVAGG
ncbi:MerR family transcriptional regulator [Streptomyces sp. FXJ1.4098]|nr:MerR family transcriptional regulator [Streptomyces sp. FXJ1.4098]